jgi:hypothetical protein
LSPNTQPRRDLVRRTSRVREKTLSILHDCGRMSDLAHLLLMASVMDLHRLVHRVRSEFNEMPGLQLTLPQAARLWGLDHEASRLVIDALVERSFLRWTARGTVVRVDRTAA